MYNMYNDWLQTFSLPSSWSLDPCSPQLPHTQRKTHMHQQVFQPISQTPMSPAVALDYLVPPVLNSCCLTPTETNTPLDSRSLYLLTGQFSLIFASDHTLVHTSLTFSTCWHHRHTSPVMHGLTTSPRPPFTQAHS